MNKYKTDAGVIISEAHKKKAVENVISQGADQHPVEVDSGALREVGLDDDAKKAFRSSIAKAICQRTRRTERFVVFRY